jgi:alanine dehydrogenase
MLELNGAEVEQLLTVDVALEALRLAYGELGARRAVNRPRSDVYLPTPQQGRYYVFKSMEGALPAAEVVALRLNSDFIAWHAAGDGVVKEREPVASGNVIFLFSSRTGELLGLLPDPYLQKMRVGASGALAAALLARPGAAVVGLLGTGGIARTHLLGLSHLLPLERVRVYSPNAARRARFAAALTREAGRPVEAVDDPEQAVRGADIVVTATSAITPVLHPEWVGAGTFLTCVKHVELGDAVVARADLVVVNSRHLAPANYLVGHGEEPVLAHDPLEALGLPAAPATAAALAWESFSTLAEVVAGSAPGRQDPDQIVCFVNNIGIGVQFAAVAAAVLARAREAGLGREIDIPWFRPGATLASQR